MQNNITYYNIEKEAEINNNYLNNIVSYFDILNNYSIIPNKYKK